MKRLAPILCTLALFLCLTPHALAASTDADQFNSDLQDYMDSMEEMEFPTAEEIKEYLSDLLNIDGLTQAGNALTVFLSNTYIFRIYLTAFILALLSYILFGKR